MQILFTWPTEDVVRRMPRTEAEIIRRRVASARKWRRRRRWLQLKAWLVPRHRGCHAGGRSTRRPRLRLMLDRPGGTR